MQAKKEPRSRRKHKATTSDIIGRQEGTPPTHHVPAKWKRHYQHLLALRDRVLNRQTDLARDAQEEQPNFSTHMADAGTDTYDRDVALAMLSSEQDAVYQIDQAIDRINNGTYGVCELTGKPIEQGRLEAIPWARFGVAAERQLEAQGARPRARLGPRESVARGGEPNEPPSSEEETG